MNVQENIILLNVSSEEVEKHVTKKDILNFFKNLKFMPTIDKESIYKQVLDDKLDLPKFELENYYLQFCNYTDNQKKELVIIKDIGSDNYYYIQNENVFKCSISQSQNSFYTEIAKNKKQKYEDIYDMLVDKLSGYEAIFLSSKSKYLSNLDDFIEEYIYVFDAVLKEKEVKSKKRVKPN